MRISSDRSYRFDHDASAIWDAIGDVEQFPSWWPWLRRFDGTSITPGARWACTVQPPLPYTLSFDITIERVVPLQEVTASISGEITGTAQLTLSPAGAGSCTARLRSQLAPASRFLQGVALVARPVVRLGHDWVLDTGARQFRHHLPDRAGPS